MTEGMGMGMQKDAEVTPAAGAEKKEYVSEYKLTVEFNDGTVRRFTPAEYEAFKKDLAEEMENR